MDIKSITFNEKKLNIPGFLSYSHSRTQDELTNITGASLEFNKDDVLANSIQQIKYNGKIICLTVSTASIFKTPEITCNYNLDNVKRKPTFNVSEMQYKDAEYFEGLNVEKPESELNYINNFNIIKIDGKNKQQVYSTNTELNQITLPAGVLQCSSQYEIETKQIDTKNRFAFNKIIFNTSDDFGYIEKPTIISPSGSVPIKNGIKVQSSDFNVVDGTDTHTSSNWILSKRSGDTDIVILKAENSSDLTQHTFAFDLLCSKVMHNDKLVLQVQHNGSKYDPSEISAPYVITALTASITTPSGRYLYRHPNNKGTVIEFKINNTPRRLFVADAAYRSDEYNSFGANPSNGTMRTNPCPGLTAHSSPGGIFIFGSSTQYAAAYTLTMTDAQVWSKFSRFYNDEIARPYTPQHLTDLYCSCTAKTHARSLTWWSGGLSMPTVFDIVVMYIEGDYFDQLDPTISSYPKKCLGKYGSSGRFFDNYNAITNQICLSGPDYHSIQLAYQGIFNVNSNGCAIPCATF